jgi:hypothetical protein
MYCNWLECSGLIIITNILLSLRASQQSGEGRVDVPRRQENIMPGPGVHRIHTVLGLPITFGSSVEGGEGWNHRRQESLVQGSEVHRIHSGLEVMTTFGSSVEGGEGCCSKDNEKTHTLRRRGTVVQPFDTEQYQTFLMLRCFGCYDALDATMLWILLML